MSHGDFFAMNGGSICFFENGGLHSYRWFIKVTPREENAEYGKPSFTLVEGDVDSIATSINSANENTFNEVEGFYTAGGVKHDKPVKGINIVKYTDGSIKKIYVK